MKASTERAGVLVASGILASTLSFASGQRLAVQATESTEATVTVDAAARPQEREGGRPTMRAVPLKDGESVTLDGRLDEPFWDHVEPADGFRQREPVEGAPSKQVTEIRIAYNSKNLYIGVSLYDTNPDGIIGFQKQRDASLRSDDRFVFILDTFLDGRTAYVFETNPVGLLGDGLLRAGSGGGGGGGFGGVNRSWDGIWEVQVSRDQRGWFAEFEIPFQTLNFNPRSDTWGINFMRTVRRTEEDSLWTGYGLNEGIFQPVHAGRVSGLRELSQGLGLEVKPYGAVSYKEDSEVGSSTPGDVGFDVNYSVTPGLRAALTVNTDFAEVEVDDRQVNLTRFPLVFPEKRDFFLEGSSIFSFSRSSRPEPYFSRRIGLLEGEPVPVQFGARLTGQTGRYDVAFLQLRTGRTDLTAPEDFTVARLKRNFFAQSSVGLIYTRRGTEAFDDQSEAPPTRQTIGADLDLSTATFMGDKNLQFEAFFVANTDPFEESSTDTRDNAAWGVRVNYPNDLWRARASYREFGGNYDPAVGFVRRNGFKRFNPVLTFAPRPAGIPSVRQFQWQIFFEYLTDFENVLLTRRTRLDLFEVRFDSGDEIRVNLENNYELLDEPFEIHPGIVIPVGEYDFTDFSFRIQTTERRKVSGEFGYSRGGFWSGNRTAYESVFSLRPASGLLFATEWEYNDISLPEGDFAASLIAQRAEWQASPWMSLTTIVQYDNVSRELGMYARFRWIVNPGNDLYIVYSHNWQSLETRWLTLDRAATTKVNYTHRF